MPLHPKQITSRITNAQDLPALAAVQLEFGTAFNVIHLYAFWDRLKKIVMKDPQQRRTLRDTWANQLVPVCDQTALLLPELDARNVAALAYTLAKTGLHQSPPSDRVWDALDAIAESKIVQMDAQAVVNMAWAFATARRYSTTVFAAIALKAAKMLKQAHAQGLSNLAWAYATSGAGHDSPALFDAIAREASGRLDEFSAQGLANTAWGFASADHPAPELFDAIAAEAGSRLAEFKAQDFAQIAWAFATAGHTTSTLFEQLAGAVEEHLERFKPQELANMVWAFAKAEQDSPPLLEAIATEATVRLRLFSTQEVIIVALSFAKARYHAPSLFDHLAIEAAGRLHEFKALDYANLLWSFAAIGLETTPSNAELYAALASKVEVRLGDFQAQGLTNMAWAFAVLNPPSTGTLFASPKFVNACAARAEHLTTADLVRLHQWTIWRDERGGVLRRRAEHQRDAAEHGAVRLHQHRRARVERGRGAGLRDGRRFGRVRARFARRRRIQAAAPGRGHVCVQPLGDRGGRLDLFELVQDLQGRSLGLPLLIRFDDILEDRLERLHSAFARAIDQYDYKARYQGVFPVKCNQQRHVVEKLVSCGRRWHFGLEAGSKAELLIALSLIDDPEALLICNGYKDRRYIETATLARRLGRQPVVVIEQADEVERIIDASSDLGAAPLIGIRAKLSSRSTGRWGSSVGEQAKFGLSVPDLLKTVEALRAANLLSELRLMHFHIGSQICDIAVLKDALQEAGQIYVELHKLGAPMGYLDVGGGLGIDYDGSSTATAASTNYSLQNYANDVVATVRECCEPHGVPAGALRQHEPQLPGLVCGARRWHGAHQLDGH